MVEERQKKAVSRRPHGTGAQKKAVNRGTAKMKVAAGKALEGHSDDIAESLYRSLMGGDLTCGKLLFALADGQIDCEDEGMMERLCSLAEGLASEPQWDGAVNELEAETGFGGREPENY